MKQTFKVIPIEDYGVVVDDSPMKDGDRCIEYDPTDGNSHVFKINDRGWQVQKVNNMDTCKKVIATIGKRLDGVPLIELADEVGKIASEWADDEKEYGAFFAGYKANQNKYSEEDMRRAILKAHKLGAKGWEHSEKNVDEIIQSLQKKRIPASVALDMEIFCEAFDKAGGCFLPPKYPACGCLQQIKITNTQTNTITPLNVNYENSRRTC